MLSLHQPEDFELVEAPWYKTQTNRANLMSGVLFSSCQVDGWISWGFSVYARNYFQELDGWFASSIFIAWSQNSAWSKTSTTAIIDWVLMEFHCRLQMFRSETKANLPANFFIPFPLIFDASRGSERRRLTAIKEITTCKLFKTF